MVGFSKDPRDDASLHTILQPPAHLLSAAQPLASIADLVVIMDAYGFGCSFLSYVRP